MILYFHLNSLEELHPFTVRLLSVATTNADVSAVGIGFSFLFSRELKDFVLLLDLNI